MTARKIRAKRTTERRKPRSKTTTRSTSARRRSSRKSAPRTPAFQIALPESLPVRPSIVLLCLGGLLIGWQMIGIPVVPESGKWVSGQMAGASGVLLVVGGLMVLGLEASGLREARRTDTPSRSSETAPTPRGPRPDG